HSDRGRAIERRSRGALRATRSHQADGQSAVVAGERPRTQSCGEDDVAAEWTRWCSKRKPINCPRPSLKRLKDTRGRCCSPIRRSRTWTERSECELVTFTPVFAT